MAKEKKDKKEKKSKKSKELEDDPVIEMEVHKDNKKRRKSRAADNEEQVVDKNGTVSISENESNDQHIHKKSKRNDSALQEQEDDHVKEEPLDTWATVVDSTTQSRYEKKMKNTFLSREERAVRENQRKMQAYVLELRAKGLDEKEIARLKQKAKKKIKHIKPNVKLSDAVGLSDKTLECKDCGNGFTFSVREQHFYQQKNFADPVRCKECYTAKKERMANFDNNKY